MRSYRINTLLPSVIASNPWFAQVNSSQDKHIIKVKSSQIKLSQIQVKTNTSSKLNQVKSSRIKLVVKL